MSWVFIFWENLDQTNMTKKYANTSDFLENLEFSDFLSCFLTIFCQKCQFNKRLPISFYSSQEVFRPKNSCWKYQNSRISLGKLKNILHQKTPQTRNYGANCWTAKYPSTLKVYLEENFEKKTFQTQSFWRTQVLNYPKKSKNSNCPNEFQGPFWSWVISNNTLRYGLAALCAVGSTKPIFKDKCRVASSSYVYLVGHVSAECLPVDLEGSAGVGTPVFAPELLKFLLQLLLPAPSHHRLRVRDRPGETGVGKFWNNKNAKHSISKTSNSHDHFWS